MLPNSNSALKLGTRFVIGPENNRDGDITMLLSLKTIGFGRVLDEYRARQLLKFSLLESKARRERTRLSPRPSHSRLLTRAALT